MFSADKASIINLKSIKSNRLGSLTPVYNNVDVPFEIKRVYYLYDIPSGSERGGHAHKILEQLFVAVSGSFDVHLNDGKNEEVYHLNRPSIGLYIPKMTWRELKNFSGGGICLVLASQLYDKEDYYHNFDKFLIEKKSNSI